MIMVPTGRTVLTRLEQQGLPDKLLNFSFTIGTMYVYEEICGKRIKDFDFKDKQGKARMGDIIDLLYAGLYDIDNPEKSPTKAEIARSYTSKQAPVVNTMIARVIEASSPTPTEEIRKKAQEMANSPNRKSP